MLHFNGKEKMKNISFKTILLSVIILISGCGKDFLDTVSTNRVDDTAIFATVNNAKNVINGMYRNMYRQHTAQNRPGEGGMILQMDFMGEDIHQAVSTWYTQPTSTGNWRSHINDTHSWVSFAYSFYFSLIGNANAILDNIDAAEGSDIDRAVLKGEALTFRAWAYHHLVRMYAKRYDKSAQPNDQPGVPLALSFTDSRLPRSTVEEVYEQINKDLDDAIAVFDTHEPFNKSHLSIDAARAIKANVLLTMQEYELAAQYAQDVISAGKYSLMSQTEYQSGFSDISNPEWIWGARIELDQQVTFANFHAQISIDGNTAYIRNRPKRINSVLYDFIPDTDIRKTMWEPSPTPENFPTTLSPYTREPYMHRKFKVRVPGTTVGDVPYFRLAEVYLTRAEALANIPGREADAREVLRQLNVTRDPDYNLSTNSGADLIEEILNYRRVELWAEGRRWYDLKRLNRPLDRGAVPNFVSASVGETMFVPAGDPRWQWAIPRAEIDANPNVVPND